MSDLTYRQQLALFCLATHGEPITGADLMLVMGETAMAAGHDKQHWTGFTPAKIVADLRDLERRNLVVRSEQPFRNTRRGRDEPRWEVVKKAEEFALPMPPEARAAATTGHVVQVQARPIAGAVPTPYEGMPVKHLMLLLEIHDELAAATARHIREVAAINANARIRLAAAGLLSE